MNTAMDKRCEFCASLSPIVYCKSDAAHLCLSCDAKVHSANALSYRHPRTLICESCRYQPASVRCFGHEMFMCQTCDASNHQVAFDLPHDKKEVGCYVGCPSARDLAALWGFELNELESNCNEFEGGSSSRGTKVVKGEKWQQNSNLILQQIHDLERLQLSEGIIDNSFLAHLKDRTGRLSIKHDTTWRFHANIDNHKDHFDLGLDSARSLEDKIEEPLSLPFSQLDNFTSTVNPLQGDSFWQYKSPAHNNEIWFQNIQDLGVCDEVQCFDAVDIPDVDLTFRNFEELFGNEHEISRVDGENMTCLFADRDFASTIEDKIDTSEQVDHPLQNNYHPRPIRPSYSASSSSFSVSRITGESSGSEYKDDGLSPSFPKQMFSQVSYDMENTKLDAKENVKMTYKEKKVSSQLCIVENKISPSRHDEQAQYASPKSKSGGKKKEKV